MARPIAGTTALERLLSRTEKTETCWLFRGSIHRRGYAYIRGLSGNVSAAHRLSWEIHYGPIPEGLSVLHKCDARNCINPSHLFLGDHPKHVLKDDDVAEVKRLLSDGALSQAAIGLRFGIGQAAISKIKTGRTRSAFARTDFEVS